MAGGVISALTIVYVSCVLYLYSSVCESRVAALAGAVLHHPMLITSRVMLMAAMHRLLFRRELSHTQHVLKEPAGR